jgi:hypothetical protein
MDRVFFSTGSEHQKTGFVLFNFPNKLVKLYFLSFPSWAIVIKLFTSEIHKCSNSARVFVPGKLFQPGLMFVGKARNLP